MSELVVMNARTVMDKVHKFYCDDCGKYLGYTTEFDDGYYSRIGDLSLGFHTPRGWRTIKKYFCDDCRENFLSELDDSLLHLGFKGDAEDRDA